MGYSIGLYARSKALQEKMLSFMEKEYRSHWEIRGVKAEPCYTSYPTADPAYCHGERIIGINYGAVAGFEREYAYTLVRWMALKVGTRRRTFFKDPKVTFDEPVPCMTYDGHEVWPLLVTTPSKVPKRVRWCCVDEYGMDLQPRGSEFVIDLRSMDSYIEAIARAQRKFGIKSGDAVTPKNRDLFWKAREEADRMLLPQVRKILAPMRVEMERLDAAWEAL